VAAEMRSYRPVIIGASGAVAANHPLATQAGLLALRAGGNAVDAAVATAATLAVVEPMMSGLGGDGFYHVWDRAAGHAVVFNGTGPAPAAATPERYAGRIPRIGPLSVSVPGTVSALGKMHRSFWPATLARPLRRGDHVCPRRVWRHPSLWPFRR
jgi:gamma-glutamyltranspeptidase